MRALHGETYALILAETAHHIAANLPPWRSRSTKDEFPFNVPSGFSKKVIQPYDLYPCTFRIGGMERYIFESPQGRRRWSYYPEYMEFSLQTLKEGRYCAFGWVLLSSSQDECPIARDCPARQKSPCQYYFPPMAYSSLYNVYPLIRKKYETSPERFDEEPLFAVRYRSVPLLTLTYIPNGSYVAFIDGVQFSPKQARVFRQPFLFLKEGLGFRISQAPAIRFEFMEDSLRELIRDSLKNNLTLTRWIKLKQELFLGHDNSSNLIRERNGFGAFQKMDEIVLLTLSGEENASAQIKALLRSIDQPKIDDDLLDFASALFIHSFSHLFLNWISAKYGYGRSDFGYYLEHPIIQPVGLQHEGIRTFIFEAAVGGLGYLRSFAQEMIDTNANIFVEFLGSKGQGIQSILEFCENRANHALSNLHTELNKFRGSDQAINSLIDAIIAGYSRCFTDRNVFPHINSIRRGIVDTISMTTEMRGLMDDLIGKGPHCWDGCQLCVMQERGCNYLPFDQPFIVSRGLSKDIVATLAKMVKSQTEVFPLKVGIENEFRCFVLAARYSIDLVSPWLSPEVINLLKDVGDTRKLNIRIITTPDLSNKVHEESLELLRRTKDKIQVRICPHLHAKGMLVDKIMLLTGTFNFTISGLRSNVENVIVDFSRRGTFKFEQMFQKIWTQSEDLN
ncbi:MAG: phospholipase D family protein [Candidatus Bathyarchaeia archaeon]